MKKILRLLFTATVLFGSIRPAAAQQKVAYIDASKLIAAMPETDTAAVAFNKFQDGMIRSFNQRKQEYEQKDSIYKKDSLKWYPAMRDIRRSEVQQLKEYAESMLGYWDEVMQKKNAQLLAPIRAKALAAIEAVVKQQGYSKWVYAADAAPYKGAVDILPLVKKKLGIR